MEAVLERLDGFRCFECNGVANHAHHVVPFSRGGTRTVPLCESCHGCVHDLDFESHSRLTKEGLERARQAGKRIGRPPKPVNREELKEKRQAGLSYTALAELFGISPSLAQRIVKEDRE